jgi:hypothetical protein
MEKKLPTTQQLRECFDEHITHPFGKTRSLSFVSETENEKLSMKPSSPHNTPYTSIKFKSNSVLSYHLVVGKFKLADLKDGQVLTTKHGGTLKIVFKDGSPTVNGAKMTTTDIEAGNGVVHMIDAVLLPAVHK